MYFCNQINKPSIIIVREILKKSVCHGVPWQPENAKSVLNVYMKEGLYQAKKVKGGYKVERVKLNSSKGKKLMNILNQLDENGRYPSERPKPGNDRIRRYEALQNSLR